MFLAVFILEGGEMAGENKVTNRLYTILQ